MIGNAAVLNGVRQKAEPVVIIDDDKSICKTLKLHFERQGFEVKTSQLAYDGLRLLEAFPSAIVILDVRLPDANGIDLLKEIRQKGENYYSIIITAFPDMESTIKAVQNGVGEYIHKPLDIQEVDNAIENARNFFMNSKSKETLVSVPVLKSTDSQFIGKSNVMKELFKTVGMVSMGKATVHITGESGTGKELVAKAIHVNSAAKSAPFISINCSAIVDTLLESELFGHVKGAFTGAINQKEGMFSMAGDGAIFLDEISEMSVNLQAKLLRVLQEREFQMVGGKEKLKANCRVISASNRDLQELVEEGKFREDLYYRMKVVDIKIPPLRDRKEDIPDLALYFVGKANLEIGRKIKYISQEAIQYLSTISWKGNVRELENTITHAVTMSRDNRLRKKNFTSIIKENETEKTESVPHIEFAPAVNTKDFMPMSLNELEKEQVHKTLSHTKWHKGKTCSILGISRPRLDRKIKKYGIKPSKPLFQEN